MALSGSISTNKYTTQNHGSIGLILSWTASQSIDNNQTTINWTLKSYGTMSSGYSVQAGPARITKTARSPSRCQSARLYIARR